jgi:hypothetical protein
MFESAACMQDLSEVMWALQDKAGCCSISELAGLTALTALELVPVVWPQTTSPWQSPLNALTNLRHLMLPTPFPMPEIISEDYLLCALGGLPRLEAINCMGLKVSGIEAHMLWCNNSAPVWACMLKSITNSESIRGRPDSTPHWYCKVVDVFH